MKKLLAAVLGLRHHPAADPRRPCSSHPVLRRADAGCWALPTTAPAVFCCSLSSGAVCGFPLEIFSKAFPKAMRTLGLLGARGEKILFLILDTVSTTVVMLIV